MSLLWLIGCAGPVTGWLDGLPVRDLEGAALVASPDSVLEVAEGAHEVHLQIDVPMQLIGRPGAVLTGAQLHPIVSTTAAVAISDLDLIDAFGMAIEAQAPLELTRVSIGDARGTSVQAEAELTATSLLITTPWPGQGIVANGDLLLQRSELQLPAGTALSAQSTSISVSDCTVTGDLWGVGLAADDVSVDELHVSGALTLHAGTRLTAEHVSASIIFASATDGGDLVDVRAQGISAQGVDLHQVLLIDDNPALALVDGSLTAVVMVAETEPARISLGDARVNGLLVIDAEPDEIMHPLFFARGQVDVSHLTWIGGQRTQPNSAGQLHLDQSVLAGVELQSLGAFRSVTATHTAGWGDGLAQPASWRIPWERVEPQLDGVDLTPDAPLFGLGPDGYPGAFGGPHGATVAGLWEESG